MAGEEDEPDVFSIPDFWQTSKWLDELGQQTPAPFFNNGLKGRALSPTARAKADF